MRQTAMLRNFYIGGAEYSIEYNLSKKIPYNRRLEIVQFIEENIQKYNKYNVRKKAMEKFHIPISLETEGKCNVFIINKESA